MLIFSLKKKKFNLYRISRWGEMDFSDFFWGTVVPLPFPVYPPSLRLWLANRSPAASRVLNAAAPRRTNSTISTSRAGVHALPAVRANEVSRNYRRKYEQLTAVGILSGNVKFRFEQARRRRRFRDIKSPIDVSRYERTGITRWHQIDVPERRGRRTNGRRS